MNNQQSTFEGPTLDVSDLSVQDLEVLDSFYAPYGTAVIRTQVSSSSVEVVDPNPKARKWPMLRRSGYLSSGSSKTSVMEPMFGRFRSAGQMVAAGFCRLKGNPSRIVPIPEGARLGIADQDCIWEPEEKVRILNAIDPGNRVFRLFCLYDFVVGPRVSQCLGVHVYDVDFCMGRVLINPSKEGDPFYAELWPEILEETAEYIRFYGLKRTDYLFCVHHVNGRFDCWVKNNYAINRRTVAEWLTYYANKAGVNWQYVDTHTGLLRNRVHTHMAKDTSCSDDYQICKDPLLVARLHGNRSSACVEKYYIKFRNSYMTSTRHKALKKFRDQLYPRIHADHPLIMYSKECIS